jgi:chromosome segregation ATPase
MASNKRKSGDIFAESNRGPAVVVVGTSNHNNHQTKDDVAMKKQLENLRRNELDMQDPILKAIKGIDEGSEYLEEAMLSKAKSVKSKLEGKLELARDACQHESQVLMDMGNKIERMKQERKNLLQNMEKLDQKQIILQKNISKHQDEASQEIESIDQVEEEQKRQVPRLKTQISLYASTTGIKWDFANDEILSGHVVSPISLSNQKC